jgi:CRISPR-associated endonuclease/helicase Cas3
MQDFGKYSSAFQNYMRVIITEQTGYNPDNDEGGNF